MSCLGLHHVPLSLACHVYFMLCSISLDVFVFCLSFIFSFILHPSCIIFYPCSYLIFFPFFLLIHLSIRDKKGESILESIPVCFVISIWLTCTILRGENYTSCTFVGGESHRRDAYTKGKKTFFFRKPCFVLFYLILVFLLFYGALSYIL